MEVLQSPNGFSVLSTDFIFLYPLIEFNSIFNLVTNISVVSRPDKLSGADLSSIIQAAGMYAVRVLLNLTKANRYVILSKDIEKAYVANVKKPDMDLEFYR